MGTNYYFKNDCCHIGKTTCGIIGGEFIWDMSPTDFIVKGLESENLVCDEYGREYEYEEFQSKISLLEWQLTHIGDEPV
jgi:hypothetical protein